MNLYLFDDNGNPTNAPAYIQMRDWLFDKGFEDTGDVRTWDSDPVQDIEIPCIVFEHDLGMTVELAYDGHFCVGESVIGEGLDSLKTLLFQVYNLA